MGRGLGRVVGEQEPGGLERLPHPPGRVEPRGDGEGDGLEVDGLGRDPCALEERRDARARRAPQALEAEPGDRPVLADDRRHVGDGPDRREVASGRARRAGPPGSSASRSWATLNATPLPARRRSG